jgi:hypothetical protein
MDRYGGSHLAFTIALHGGLYLAIIMARYGWPHTAFTIHLAWKPLLSHYNGPLLRASHCPYYSLAMRPLLSQYNGRYGGPHFSLTIALRGGLYLFIIMDRC